MGFFFQPVPWFEYLTTVVLLLWWVGALGRRVRMLEGQRQQDSRSPYRGEELYKKLNAMDHTLQRLEIKLNSLCEEVGDNRRQGTG